MNGLLEDLQDLVNDLNEAYAAGRIEDVKSLAEELRALARVIENTDG